MPILDSTYASLADNVLRYGYKKPSRVGETISLPGQSIQTSLVGLQFPILTTRRIYSDGVIGELAAFLQGATTLEQFKAAGCNYWKHNAGQWARNKGIPEQDWLVGKVYGAQWRDWGRTGLDQLQMLVDGILSDRYGRRHILTTWNPEELDQGCLPPCHLLAQFYARNDTLDCVVYMRSVDIALGLPSDLVLYGTLLMLVAKEVNMSPGYLYMHFGDAHIYMAHAESMRKQLGRQAPITVPKAVLSPKASLFDFSAKDFSLTNYEPLEAIKYELF